MPFPFLLLAISMAAGIVFSSLFLIPPQIPLSLLAFILFLAWIFFFIKKNTLCLSLSLLSCALLGSGLFALHNKSFEQNPIHLLHYEGYVDLYGTLSRSVSRGLERDILYLRVRKISFGGQERRLRGRVRLTIPHSDVFIEPLNFFTGEKLKVSARLLSSEGYRNFNVPGLDDYLKRNKIHSRAFSKSHLLIERIGKGKSPAPLHLVSKLRRKFQQKIEKYFPSPDPYGISRQGAVLEALLLGERGRLSPALSSSLQKTGLYHLFAISGAHIAIISFLLFTFFKLFHFPTRVSYSLIICILFLYAFLVEGRPSVMRATIMAIAFLLGKLIWKDVNLLNTISLAAFSLLFINPFYLFDLGFQLTFAASYCIIFFFPRVIKFLPPLPLRLSEIFALSVTAQLGVLPFIANSFNRVTFFPLLLNFAALPLIGFIMAAGFIFLPLSFTFPFLAELLARTIHSLVTLFFNLTRLADTAPFLSYRIPNPPLLVITGYFVTLLALLLPKKVKGQRIFFSAFFLLFFLVLVTYPFTPSSHHLRVTFIDVGQGDSILVEFPGRAKMLIDGGGDPRESFDVGERVVSPFLWRKGIKKINFLILTHAHPDHLNGLKAVVKNFRIGELWEAFSPAEDPSYSEFKKSIPSRVVLRRVFRNDTIREGKIKVEIIHPAPALPFVDKVENNQSLVLRIAYGKTSFLLTSDIEYEAESEILASGKEITSTVLKSPHHGSATSSSELFLKKVNPSIVVISVRESIRQQIPAEEVLDRYQKLKAAVFRTDRHGAVEISSDGEKLLVRSVIK